MMGTLEMCLAVSRVRLRVEVHSRAGTGFEESLGCLQMTSSAKSASAKAYLNRGGGCTGQDEEKER
jgi:hypothetical protein